MQSGGADRVCGGPCTSLGDWGEFAHQTGFSAWGSGTCLGRSCRALVQGPFFWLAADGLTGVDSSSRGLVVATPEYCLGTIWLCVLTERGYRVSGYRAVTQLAVGKLSEVAVFALSRFPRGTPFTPLVSPQWRLICPHSDAHASARVGTPGRVVSAYSGSHRCTGLIGHPSTSPAMSISTRAPGDSSAPSSVATPSGAATNISITDRHT